MKNNYIGLLRRKEPTDNQKKDISGSFSSKNGWLKSAFAAATLLLGGSSYAQTNVASYSFTKSTGNTYTPITAGTKLFPSGTNTSYDNDMSTAITLPTPFPFGGANVTTCYISSNGFITFGSVLATYDYTALSILGTSTGAVAAFAQDGASSTATGAVSEVRYQDLGTEFVIQWQDHANYYNRATEKLNFQIRLNYATGAINIVYGTSTNPGTGDASNGTTTQVGVRGNSIAYSTNVSPLMIGNVPTGTTCDWSKAVTGNSNSSTMLFSSTNVNVKIPTGLQYTWTPGTQLPVRTFAATTAVTNSGATLNWTAPTGATTYNVQYRVLGSCDWTNFSGNPVSAATASLSGLNQNTTYQVQVQALNGAVESMYSNIPSLSGGNGYVAAGSFTTVANCISTVTGLASSALAPDTATISWTASTTAPGNGYEYYYSTSSTAPLSTTTPSGAVGAGITTVNLSGLTPSTQYYYWVRGNCNGTDKGVWSSSANFTTLSLCPAVTLPVANAIDVITTPTISWTAINGATGYKLKVGTTSGGNNILDTNLVGGITNYTFATPLNNSTMYYYSVSAYTATTAAPATPCTIRNFTTSCPAVNTLPLVENFDTTPTGSSSNTNAPSCWKYLEPASWAGYGYVSTSYTSSAPNGYYIYNDAATTAGGMLVSPQITPLSNGLNRVRFMAVGGSAGYILQVGTLSNPADATTFTQISSITLTATMAQYTVNIPSGSNQYLVFRHGVSSTYTSIGIDDINIQPIPTCDNPTTITVPSTLSNGASISWTAPSSTVGVGYDVYYSTTSTAPNASTVLNATNSVSVTGTATTASVTGLVPDAFYYVWVRAKCSATDNSAWEGGSRFYTSNYCTPTTANQNTWISAFTSTTANVNMAYSSATAGSSATFGYKNLMSSNNITVAQSASNTVIPISVTSGSGTVGVGVWVDFNQNNVFDTAEKLYATTGYVSATSGATLTIPANTPIGTYRMRVLMNFNNSTPTDACASFVRGEILDYSLNVTTFLATSETTQVKNNLKVYPNPFADVLNISDVKNVKSVSIVDIAGRLVKTIEKPSSALQLGDLKSGMYVVVLNMNDGSKQTIKAIKK